MKRRSKRLWWLFEWDELEECDVLRRPRPKIPAM
jgi:hypothetical protein